MLALTQILFLWLKWTDEGHLDDGQEYIGKEQVVKRFEKFVQFMNQPYNTSESKIY